MAGPETFERYVVIEFPTFDQGVACFQSPEYQEASVFRLAGGVVDRRESDRLHEHHHRGGPREAG